MQKEKQTFLAKCADPNQSALPDQCLHCFQTDNKYIRAHMTGSSKLKSVDYMTLGKGVVKNKLIKFALSTRRLTWII